MGRNLRAAGNGELRIGKRVEGFVAEELPDSAKPPVLREYLRLWKFEVGRFFDGLDEDATPQQLRAIGAGVPVFRIGRPS